MHSAADAVDRLPTILVVDDEAWNRTLVEAILSDNDYRVVEAENGPEALELVEQELPDLVLLDIMMPRMDGFEVCRRLKEKRSSFFVPVVMLTALSDRESKIRGLDAGADEFLNKPINRIELLARLRSLLRIRRLRDELDSADRIMLSMVEALEAKGTASRDHSLRVAALAARSAERLGLPREDREAIVWGALLHDLGKIGVPDAVLEQSAGLRSPEDQRFYRLHAEYGERLLAPLASFAAARPIVRHHHERLDGSGYPDGLSGADFSPAIEVVAAANVYDRRRLEWGDDPGRVVAEMRLDTEHGKFRPRVIEEILQAAQDLGAETPEVEALLPSPTPPTHGVVWVADDSPANRLLYEEILGASGFGVETFDGGPSLLAAMRERPCDLALVDVKMPGASGEQICRRIKADSRYERLPVVLVTAHEDATGKERALASGADDFLTLPIDRQELLARVRSLLRLRAYHRDLEQHETVVLSLSGLLEAKDPYTRGHSARVGELAHDLAVAMGSSVTFAAEMRTSGLLHDIGKVAIPEQVLHKKGAPTPEEWDLLKTHPVRGWEICRELRTVSFALGAIRHHHERFDGSGYPDGLVGADTPLAARIMGVADAFDALTSERPYRGKLDTAESLAILRHETDDGKWDPEIMTALETVVR